MLKDGRVASAAADTTVRIWNPTTATQEIKIELRTAAYGMVVLDNGNLAVACGDHSVVVYEIIGDVAERVATLTGHTSTVFCVAPIRIAPGGNILASGSRDTTVVVWDLQATDGPSASMVLRGHADIVGALLQLEDFTLVSGSTDTTLKVWDLTTAACTQTLSGHLEAVIALVLLPGKLVASASEDMTVRVWDMSRFVCRHVLRGHTGSVWGLIRLPNNLLLSGGDDANIILWAPERGERLTTLHNPDGPIHDMDLHPDGILLTANHDDFSIGHFQLPPWLLAAPTQTLVRGFHRAHTHSEGSIDTTAAAALSSNDIATSGSNSIVATATCTSSMGAPAHTALKGTTSGSDPGARPSSPAVAAAVPAPVGGNGSKSEDVVMAAEVARLRGEVRRYRDAEFATNSELANLKGVIATLLRTHGTPDRPISSIQPTTDHASIGMTTAVTAALAEQNARIRELQARNRVLEQLLQEEQTRVRELARVGALPSQTLGRQNGTGTGTGTVSGALAGSRDGECVDPVVV